MIGVVLMVAVTVILAAIIGTFVLGIGGDQTTTPQATFEVEKTQENGGSQPDELRITHTGGNTIDADNLYLSIGGTNVQKPGGGSTGERVSWTDLGFGDDIVGAGDSIGFEPDNSNPQIEDRTVRVIWEDDAGGGSVIVFTWEAPQN